MTDKVKRTVLTPAERVAKLEGELAAAKAKAEKRANQATDKLLERRASLTAQMDKLQGKIDIVDSELRSLGFIPEDEPTISTDVDQFV